MHKFPRKPGLLGRMAIEELDPNAVVAPTEGAEAATDFDGGAASPEASMLEAGDAQARADDARAEVENKAVAIEHLLRAVKSLEDAAGNGGLTEEGAELLNQNVEQAAVIAGEAPDAATQNMPATESWSGLAGRGVSKGLAVEAIGNTVKRYGAQAIEALSRFIASMSKAIENYFSSLESTKANLVKQLASIKGRQATGGAAIDTAVSAKLLGEGASNPKQSINQITHFLRAALQQATGTSEVAGLISAAVASGDLANLKKIKVTVKPISGSKAGDDGVMVFVGLPGSRTYVQALPTDGAITGDNFGAVRLSFQTGDVNEAAVKAWSSDECVEALEEMISNVELAEEARKMFVDGVKVAQSAASAIKGLKPDAEGYEVLVKSASSLINLASQPVTGSVALVASTALAVRNFVAASAKSWDAAA